MTNMGQSAERNSGQIVGSLEFIAMMAVLMSVVAISIDATLPALGIIGNELKVAHPNQAQYIISFIFAGMAIGQLVSGPLSDALGRKKVLYGGLVIYLVGSVVCLLSHSIEVMLVGRFIQGLGVSGPYVSTMSIVRDKYSGRGMARIMSLVTMIFIMVPVIAPAIGQGILFLASWRYIFGLYILYALVVGTWVFFRLDETLPPKDRIAFKAANIMHGVKTVLQNRVTVTYTITMGLVFGALIGDLNSIQQIFQDQYKVGSMFAVYFGLQALSMGASSLINSHLVEKLGMRYICIRAVMVMIVASLILLVLHAFGPISFWAYFFYGMALLFCVGLLFGNLNALAMEPMGHIAGMASAIIGASSSVIGLTLGTIIGQLYDGTLFPIICGFLVLGGAAFLIMFFERSHLEKAPQA